MKKEKNRNLIKESYEVIAESRQVQIDILEKENRHLQTENKRLKKIVDSCGFYEENKKEMQGKKY